MVTKLLSYFCSLTKVSAISCDLFGSCAVGHALHSGLERMEREGEEREMEYKKKERREKGQRSWRGGKVTVGEKHMESKGHSVGEVIKSESGAQASETQAVILALLCRFETLSSETFSN